MRDPVVSLADLDRLAAIAPQMPAHQVVDMLRWIAEIQDEAELRIKLCGPKVEPAACGQTQVCTLDMGDGPILFSPEPIQPIPAEAAPFDPADHPTFLQPEPDPSPKPVAAEETPPAPPPAGPSRAGMPWEEYEKVIAWDMYGKRQAVKVIAIRLNRPYTAVSKMLEALRKQKGTNRPAPVASSKPAPVAVTPPDPAQAPRPPHLSLVLNTRQRDLMARIMRLADDFSPKDDLYMVEALIGRTPLDVIADQLGCDGATVKARWHALLGFDPKDRKGGIPLDHQSDLVTVLRQLAGEAAA